MRNPSPTGGMDVMDPGTGQPIATPPSPAAPDAGGPRRQFKHAAAIASGTVGIALGLYFALAAFTQPGRAAADGYFGDRRTDRAARSGPDGKKLRATTGRQPPPRRHSHDRSGLSGGRCPPHAGRVRGRRRRGMIGAMKAEHFQTTIRAFRKRTPFQPYLVESVSGDRVRVDHPEALVIRGGVAVFLAPDGAPAIFDREGVSQIIATPTEVAAA